MKNQLKHIAFISEHASPLADLGGVDTGGQNVYVAQLAKHLANDGYLVDVFTRRESVSQKDIVNWLPGVRVIHIGAGPADVIAKEELLQYMDEFKSNMLRFINEQRFDYSLVHANFFMSALVAMGIKQVLGIPFVVTFHALGYVRRAHQGGNDNFPMERLAIETEAVKQADYIIAECPQDKTDLMELYNAPSEKITIIPCGFSATEFKPMDKQAARKLLGLPQHEQIILQLGRMVPRKGVDNVIRALGYLKAAGQTIKLLIVGGECEELEEGTCPEYARLLTIAREHNVVDNIIFAGRKNRDKLKFYYSAADIFITTPWYEPFGITPLEAMACGTPVIGSNVGGIKYSVADGQTGALVDPHNPKMLADKVAELFEDPALLEQMGENAIKRVNSQFTWAKVSSQVNNLYMRLQPVAINSNISLNKYKAA
ncbi:glycosyltransferase family 1 protein [Mucilaginibacter pallidiroseus]|uniref:Glycosyltransferase family 1 protein n=1 Tax=Mucilaginibacter pallidiroseus TaxID=2599295 RepID=A0A563UJH8_9SPHI|nr:glycosyltransferase family 1 protein [Mucilaginibacter pallidiroseus]TWR31540.1 glycosyltransferase family 1 protein [Mucilaginibacter pallidiroseus]